MHSFIPTIGLLFCLNTLASAQKPATPAESICNFAGTISLGQFIGQSNHAGPDTIFLCHADSILIQHNGDAILTGDPIPATPAGICFGFYTCPPTISGDNLQAIAAVPGPGDPCVLSTPPASSGLYITEAIPNGGATWFFNTGALQNIFGLGQPLQLYFAPMTIDKISSPAGFESDIVGSPPGPCVHVNIAEAFPVVYLNEITTYQIDNDFGNDCLGKFRLKGGYPEFNFGAAYHRDIALQTDTSIKALILTPDVANLSNQLVIFSVTTPGVYTISIEDGKSCGYRFQMDMSGCNAADNLVLSIDSITADPGMSVCVPIRVRNFNIASGIFSIHWDATLLRFQSITNLHPAISSFFNPATSLNTTLAEEGKIGMVLANLASPKAPITIPDDGILFELCLEVLDTLSNCTSLAIGPNPALISFEDPGGLSLGVSTNNGSACSTPPQVSTYEPRSIRATILPNPIKSGENAQVLIQAADAGACQLMIRNAQGNRILEQHNDLHAGENRLVFSTLGWASGIYFVGLVDARGAAMAAYPLLVIR